MSKNKHAAIRYQIIDRCLSGGRMASSDELMEAIADEIGEISIRTLRDDIRSMREDNGLGYLAPIEFDRKKKRFHYKDPSFSIQKVPLNDEDLEALTYAASIFNCYKEVDIFNRIPGAVQKLVDAVHIRKQHSEKKISSFVEFESSPRIGGGEHLEILGNAILKKQVITITYKAFDKDDVKEYIIHPYYLKEYRNRWYLLGLDDDKNDIITFGLERIVKLTKTANRFYRHIEFDPKEYFRNSIGITVVNKATDPQTIELRFARLQGSYIKTQPLHESQEVIKDDKDGLVVRYKICPNYEFRSLILSYGENCEVLKPTSLRKEICEAVKKMMESYK